jgi:hypothetical protein
VHTLGDLFQEGRGDFLIGWVQLEVDRNENLLSLFVDVSNIDTTLMGEENPVALIGNVSMRRT